jgi:hypothetical protein
MPSQKITLLFIVLTLTVALFAQTGNKPAVISRVKTTEKPIWHDAIYLEKKGYKLRSGDRISLDNEESWIPMPMTPDPVAGLPKGYRRNPITSVVDPRNGNLITIVNALDVKDLDPAINEPPIGLSTYYLRYRVSTNAGKTWAVDEPIIQTGNFTIENPFPGINIGKSSIFLGDAGSIPVVTKKGNILVPAQATLEGPNGTLANPGKGYTYTDVVILIGRWKKNKIKWIRSSRVQGDPTKSTRGMIEPTIIEMNDGRLLMVMRGSNEISGSRNYDIPGYKWCSASNDGGNSWTTPTPFGYEDGSPFYSPSAMSTLFKHSSGRVFWFGNMTEENSKGNLPRWPLVMGEVNTKNLKLIKSSVLAIDKQQEEDKSRGRLDISHFRMIENRETKEIILTYPRNYNAYKETEWITVRITVK